MPVNAKATLIDAKTGANIRRAREALGWDLGDLAKKVDLSRMALSDMERGKRRWPFNKFVRIAHAVGKDYAVLIDGEDKP